MFCPPAETKFLFFYAPAQLDFSLNAKVSSALSINVAFGAVNSSAKVKSTPDATYIHNFKKNATSMITDIVEKLLEYSNTEIDKFRIR